jgi:serine/threonine-protein kinase RsbW
MNQKPFFWAIYKCSKRLGVLLMSKTREIFKITLPNKPEYVPLVRMIIACIATKLNARMDTLEEMKLALSEACNRIIKETNNEKICISFEIRGKSIICKFDNYRKKAKKKSKKTANEYERNISETFMNSFMDKVLYGKELIMEKKIT